MSAASLGNLLITAFVLLALFILGYCGITHKTLTDFFMEIKEIFASKKEEVLG